MKRTIVLTVLVVLLMLAFAGTAVAAILHNGNDARTVEVEQIIGEDWRMEWTIYSEWYAHPERTPEGVMYCDDTADVHVIRQNPTFDLPVKIICYERYEGIPFPTPGE
jgi:hypothetical protein